MPDASPRIRRFAAPLQIPLRHDPKRADGCQHPAFGAVDLIDAVTLANEFAPSTTRHIEISREHVARVVFAMAIAFFRSTAATLASLAEVASAAIVGPSRIVS